MAITFWRESYCGGVLGLAGIAAMEYLHSGFLGVFEYGLSFDAFVLLLQCPSYEQDDIPAQVRSGWRSHLINHTKSKRDNVLPGCACFIYDLRSRLKYVQLYDICLESKYI